MEFNPFWVNFNIYIEFILLGCNIVLFTNLFFDQRNICNKVSHCYHAVWILIPIAMCVAMVYYASERSHGIVLVGEYIDLLTHYKP